MAKTHFEIEYRLYDLTADSDSHYTVTGEDQSLSSVSLLAAERDAEEYMTFEQNFSILDGSKGHMPGDAVYPFFSDSMAGGSGEFSPALTITDTFTENHSSSGVLVHFLDFFPYEIQVSWYDRDGVLIDAKTYHPDRLDYFCRNTVLNFRKVVLTITKANPFSYAKVNRIEYGQTYVWGETEVKEAKSSESVSMLSDNLATNKLTMKFVDVANEFNIGNQQGLHNLLQKGQTAKAYEYQDGVRQFRGKWFFKKYASEKNLTTLTLEDYLGIMDTYDYSGGGILAGVLAGPLIESLLARCGITEYEIDAETYSTPLYGCLKLMTCRKALREILFAADSIVLTTETDVLTIKKRDRLAPIVIPRSQKFSTRMQVNDYVSDVTVKYTEYEADAEASQISQAEYDAGSYTVLFNDPVVAASITVTATAGQATVTEREQLQVAFTLSEPAAVTISARKYQSTNVAVTASVEAVEGGMVRSTKSLTGTLMDQRLARAKAEAALDYYQLRHSLRVSCLAGEHRCGSWVEVENPDSSHGNFLAGVEKVDTNLTGGFLESCTMLGYYKLTTVHNYTGVTDGSGTVPDLYAGDELL